MPWQVSEVQVLQHTSVINQVVVILLDYLMACKYESWSLLIGWSWTNQGISLVRLIYLGAYELVELDKCVYVACYEMIEWIKWLVIKFGLIWVG